MMGKRKIEAKEALSAIRSGMNDHAIMAKFRLSAKGFQSLLKKLITSGLITQNELDERMPSFHGAAFVLDDMPLPGGRDILEEPTKRTPRKKKRAAVNTRQVLTDIHAGMSDGALMNKYHISARGLQRLFDQLINAGLIGAAELEQRMVSFDATVDVIELIKQMGEPIPLIGPGKRVQETCPVCGEPQTILFEECPACGANIEQYRRQRESGRKTGEVQQKCPICEGPWDQENDECPTCGATSEWKDN